MTDALLLITLSLLLVLLILSRTEVAFAIGGIGILWLSVTGQSMSIGISRLFGGMDSFVLLAIPFFLLAGELMNHANITERIVRVANVTVGRIRGGLAQANVGASLLFAGITGAAIADVAAIGSIFIPAMDKEGYDRDFSAAVTASSSLIGPIIPPSIIIVIYGAVTQTSIGGLFAAAIVPGFVIGLAMMVYILVLGYTHDLPKFEANVELREYPKIAADGVVALTMPAIILFGILGGYFTPTEAAAVACVYALFLGIFIYRSLNLTGIYAALRDSIERSVQLYIIIGFATILSWMLAREGIPRMLAESLGGAGVGAFGYMALVAVVLLFVGTWLEIGAACIMLAPTMASMADLLGVHPFQFGIIFTVTLNIGLMTPPIGMALFASSSVAEVPVWPIAKRIVPFFIIDIIVLVFLIMFPELTLWIPRQLGF
jgi:tripartite ATP-independent transporter DctM subunit